MPDRHAADVLLTRLGLPLLTRTNAHTHLYLVPQESVAITTATALSREFVERPVSPTGLGTASATTTTTTPDFLPELPTTQPREKSVCLNVAVLGPPNPPRNDRCTVGIYDAIVATQGSSTHTLSFSSSMVKRELVQGPR